MATATEPASHADISIQYLGQRQIPHETVVGGTRVGGLSGLSYDSRRGLYYAISDDKSTFGKTRFYTVRLNLSETGVDDAQFVHTQQLLDESGNPFRADDRTFNTPVVAPDAEAIVFDDARQQIYWTSEGFVETVQIGAQRVLASPWIRIAGLDGTYQGEFTLPADFVYSQNGGSGPRPNNTLEGLSLSPDGRFLFAAMEAPLVEDGPAVNADHGALIRITKFDIESRAPVGQYAYPGGGVTAADPVQRGLGHRGIVERIVFGRRAGCHAPPPSCFVVPRRCRLGHRYVAHAITESPASYADDENVGDRSQRRTRTDAAGQYRGNCTRSETA